MQKGYVLIEVYEEDIGIPDEYPDLETAKEAMTYRMEDVGVDLSDTSSYYLSKNKTEARWYNEDFSWKIFKRDGDSYNRV